MAGRSGRTLTQPAAPARKGKGGPSRKPEKPTLLGRVFARPGMIVAGASFAAVMTGIVANALILQKGHHPSPLFSPAPAEAAVPVPPPAPRQALAQPVPAPEAPAPAPAIMETPAPVVTPATKSTPAAAPHAAAKKPAAHAAAAAHPIPTHKEAAAPAHKVPVHKDPIAQLLGKAQ